MIGFITCKTLVRLSLSQLRIKVSKYMQIDFHNHLINWMIGFIAYLYLLDYTEVSLKLQSPNTYK